MSGPQGLPGQFNGIRLQIPMALDSWLAAAALHHSSLDNLFALNQAITLSIPISALPLLTAADNKAPTPFSA